MSQHPWGFVGNSIRPADNFDIYDTIQPMWEKRADLSAQERALLYAISVLADKNFDLDNRVFALEQKLNKQEGGVKRKTQEKKISKRGSKKNSKRGSKRH